MPPGLPPAARLRCFLFTVPALPRLAQDGNARPARPGEAPTNPTFGRRPSDPADPADLRPPCCAPPPPLRPSAAPSAPTSLEVALQWTGRRFRWISGDPSATAPGNGYIHPTAPRPASKFQSARLARRIGPRRSETRVSSSVLQCIEVIVRLTYGSFSRRGNQNGIGSRIGPAIGRSSARGTPIPAAYGGARDPPNCIRRLMGSADVSCTLKDMAPKPGELSANSGKRRAGRSWGLARAAVVFAAEIFAVSARPRIIRGPPLIRSCCDLSVQHQPQHGRERAQRHRARPCFPPPAPLRACTGRCSAA